MQLQYLKRVSRVPWASICPPSARHFFWKSSVCILAGIGLLVVLVTFTPFVHWLAAKMAGRWTHPEGEVLIVLAGAPSNDGILAQETYLRTMYAIREYRQRRFNTIVLSGGGNPPISTAMKEFMECNGIPGNVITTEINSLSTRENAAEVKKLLIGAHGRNVLLTSDYHIFRATRAFRKLGVDVAPEPVPDAFKRAGNVAGRWPAFVDLVKETIKIAYYYARGWC